MSHNLKGLVILHQFIEKQSKLINKTCTWEHEHLVSAQLQHWLCALHLKWKQTSETRKTVSAEIAPPLTPPEERQRSQSKPTHFKTSTTVKLQKREVSQIKMWKNKLRVCEYLVKRNRSNFIMNRFGVRDDSVRQSENLRWRKIKADIRARKIWNQNNNFKLENQIVTV